MPRLLFTLCLLFLVLAGKAQAGPPDTESKSAPFAKSYYIDDGSVVVTPHAHGFYYRHGVETPDGVRFRPGDSFVQYSTDRPIERDYWLERVNWFNNRAVFHEQIYVYKIVKGPHGKIHRVRGQLLATNEFTLTHFRGLVAFDHGSMNIESRPYFRLWRREQYLARTASPSQIGFP